MAWAFVVWALLLAAGYAALALTSPVFRRALWLSGALLAGVAGAFVGVAAKLGSPGSSNDYSDAQDWGMTIACALTAAVLLVLATVRAESRMSAPVTDRATSPIPGPADSPISAASDELFSDLAPALDTFHSTYGPICRLGGPGMRIVVIGDPNLIQEIFSTKVDKFRSKHKFNVVGVRFVVGNRSMIVSRRRRHQRRRGRCRRRSHAPACTAGSR